MNLKYLVGIQIALVVALVYGYVQNLLALIHTNLALAEFGAMEISRAIGLIVFPLGCILGYF